jgi:hypothetical protein
MFPTACFPKRKLHQSQSKAGDSHLILPSGISMITRHIWRSVPQFSFWKEYKLSRGDLLKLGLMELGTMC